MAKVGLFEESEGVTSVTRVVFFIGSLWCMFICTYIVYTYKDLKPVDLGILFASILGTLGGIKVGQKMVETKSIDIKTEDKI